ncbi:hypothetical protein L7F22_044248 [Adiantum nelumboides]|nr:hypothetical protein [Adiantum nelumboides]
MAISNNSLLEPELLAFFGANLRLQPVDLTYGTSLFGSHRLFASLCRHFNLGHTFAPVTPVRPEHLITGPGCGPLLDQLAEHLAEPGDGILVAAPYYNGYDADLACRAQVQCVAVYSSDDDGTGAQNFEGVSALRNFAATKDKWESEHAGQTVRAVLVCSPHNPVGRCYDREALISYGRFAEEHNLHLIFDEPHCTSHTSDPSFHSALSIDWLREADCDPARIHIIWSASKDFGINGLRVGTIVSQANDELLRALKATAKLYMVSSPADALFCALVDNQCVYDDFIRTNQARMAQAYSVIARWCEFHEISMKQCTAGHFVLVDLTRFLPDHVDGEPLADLPAREGALWTSFLSHAVCLTPGSNYHCTRYGTFRLTFTLRRIALLEGLSRVEKALNLPSWPHRDEALTEIEESMETIAAPENMPTVTQAQLGVSQNVVAEPIRALDVAASTARARAGRRDYVDSLRSMLKDGGGSEVLLNCGMGMNTPACA